jgi:hypothetical protein
MFMDDQMAEKAKIRQASDGKTAKRKTPSSDDESKLLGKKLKVGGGAGGVKPTTKKDNGEKKDKKKVQHSPSSSSSSSSSSSASTTAKAEAASSSSDSTTAEKDKKKTVWLIVSSDHGHRTGGLSHIDFSKIDDYATTQKEADAKVIQVKKEDLLRHYYEQGILLEDLEEQDRKYFEEGYIDGSHTECMLQWSATTPIPDYEVWSLYTHALEYDHDRNPNHSVDAVPISTSCIDAILAHFK